MATKYVSGRVKELKVGITNYSESKESLSVIGIVSATEYYGDGSNLTGTQTPGIDTTGSSNFASLNATHLKVTGISTFEGDLDIESSVLITGITTIGGLVDINAGGQANTFKVEDLTDNRVVIAGTGGELEDDANLTFNGTQFNVGSGITMYQATGIVSATKFYGDGSNLTGIDATALKDAAGNVKAQANPNGVVFTGIITGNGSGLTNLDIPGISTSSGTTFTNLTVTGITTLAGNIFLGEGTGDQINVAGNFISGLVPFGNNQYDLGTSGKYWRKVFVSDTVVTNQINASGIVTASSFDGAISEWVLGANGSSDYTFTGPGLTGAENDPTIYLKRGQKYNFKNSMGAHPFQIRTAINGSAYNDGIVNNGVSNGTLTWDVQFDAPDILYYQCTAHAGMVGKIYIGNSGDTATIGSLNATGVSTFAGAATFNALATFNGDVTIGNAISDNVSIDARVNTDFVPVSNDAKDLGLSSRRWKTLHVKNIFQSGSGISTFTGAINANNGIVASTAKVSDLTNGRVVYAGASGELQDSANLTFNGNTLTAGAFAGDGSQLTNLPGIDTAGGSTFNDVFSSGINTLGKGATGRTFLYDADVLKFQTTGLGVTVYGTTQTQQLNVSGVSTFTNSVLVNGGSGLLIGDANASLYRAADNLRIDVAGNHDFYVRTNSGGGTGGNIHLQAKLGENSIVANSDGSVDLYHDNSVRLKTTGIGITVAGVGNTAYITGPDEIWIDPSPMGVGTTSGVVRIRGDLYVDGKEVIIDVDKLEIGDFQIGIASTAGTNVQLDGAGIGIGSVSIRKSITWNNATSALMCSENWNLGSGKHYEIAGTDVLTATTLGSGVVNSSLTSLGTIASLTASTAKVSDLTNTRVVYAGASGELQDSANLTFNGTTLTANAFAGNGAALTNVSVTGINTGAGSDFTDLTVNGNLKVTGISTFDGGVNIDGNILLDDPHILGFGASGEKGYIYHSASNMMITNIVGDVHITTSDNDKDIKIQTDNGSGGLANYFLADGSTGESILYHYGTEKIKTSATGVTVSGTCQATDFNSTSDIRLKDNIQVIEDPLAKLVQIEGVSFNWKENNKPALGVIADQVQEILPELVTDGDPKTVNYNGLIGLLIEAVKEQQIQIDELKSKLP